MQNLFGNLLFTTSNITICIAYYYLKTLKEQVNHISNSENKIVLQLFVNQVKYLETVN